MNYVVLVMGVSGCGKTTVGQALAHKLGCPFYDGDDFHPPENIAKMSQGIPLTDEDRRPWLMRLHDIIAGHLTKGESAVLTCSALKRQYRVLLHQGNDGLRFVHLQGDFDLIWRRMQAREGHYMKAAMLQSQFDALEPPTSDEAITIGIDQSPDDIVTQLLRMIDKAD